FRRRGEAHRAPCLQEGRQLHRRRARRGRFALRRRPAGAADRGRGARAEESGAGEEEGRGEEEGAGQESAGEEEGRREEEVGHQEGARQEGREEEGREQIKRAPAGALCGAATG